MLLHRIYFYRKAFQNLHRNSNFLAGLGLDLEKKGN